MKIALVYSTVEGHTKKIAEHIAEHLRSKGKEVEVHNASDYRYGGFLAMFGEHNRIVENGDGLDASSVEAVVLCAPIHMGHYPAQFLHFIRSWKSLLQSVPTVLFTVCLSIVSHDRETAEQGKEYYKMVEHQTKFTPTAQFTIAGALKYVEYDFFKRWVMRSLAHDAGLPTNTKEDYELTDWKGLDGNVDKFVHEHLPKSQAPA
uniref:Flavodoxin-like domain-containing protein n=1 Tax=Compsopogon caeruleus TaxID=31354 RepID=A0A7S1THV4_9RHOD|mmetsp:Transcript_7049/g.14553  ORF Transcript_7049/g.14553 Transcript_7049/m.14553 type:complete len:204 (+) Transcript_7049:194-805(+)|eukprot:CAMPEP_0184688192 /NCGR_PEP_ID=MMETSP0312-20130426/28922_1 /TAXON_ID=31354 /ORGANISM="Compsopogon coeruleus, Strain SAG 36.94" /LENGTH=203 /DNA_ID=CAMNT_0027145061 /DNA_START=243 /DNA_END=854 /DNA_ORIENTATION=-